MKYQLPPHISSATPLGHTEFTADDKGIVEVPDGTPPEVIQALVNHCGAFQLAEDDSEVVLAPPTAPEPDGPKAQLEAPAMGVSDGPAFGSAQSFETGGESEQPENETETLESERAHLITQIEDAGGKADKRASMARLRDQVARIRAS